MVWNGSCWVIRPLYAPSYPIHWPGLWFSRGGECVISESVYNRISDMFSTSLRLTSWSNSWLMRSRSCGSIGKKTKQHLGGSWQALTRQAELLHNSESDSLLAALGNSSPPSRHLWVSLAWLSDSVPGGNGARSSWQIFYMSKKYLHNCETCL